MELVKWLAKGAAKKSSRECDALHLVRNMVSAGYAEAIEVGGIAGGSWRVLYLTDEGLAEYKRRVRRRSAPVRKQRAKAKREQQQREQAIAHAQLIATAQAEMDDMLTTDVSNDVFAGAFADDAQDGAVLVPTAETDPLIWIKECRPHIQDKREGYGLVPFEPWDYQEYIIGKVVRGEGFVIDKSRQTGVTTAIMVAYAWLLIYGRPFHGHVIANKEKVVIDACLKKVRRALETATLTQEQRTRLNMGGEGGTKFTFKGHLSENYLQGHAASPDAGHSFDGTHVLMDECARMPFTEAIYTGLSAMLDEGAGFLGIVSTYNGDGDFFCNAVDNAEAMGLEHFPISWKAHPHRDQAWYDQTRAEAEASDNLEGFMEQHELHRRGSGEQVFDIMAIERLASGIEYLGPGYKIGHRYSIGIDQSAGGAGKHVACVIDVTATPPQVVEVRVFKAKVSSRTDEDHKDVTLQRVEFCEDIALEYPGKVFIDATTEKAIPAYCKKIGRRRLRAVHSTDSQATQIKEIFDEGDRIWWNNISRKLLLGWGVATADRGRCVIHTDQFPGLLRGLKTARPAGTNKNKGKNVDHLDAFLHAAIPLRRERKTRTKKRGDERIPSSDGLKSIVGQRW